MPPSRPAPARPTADPRRKDHRRADPDRPDTRPKIWSEGRQQPPFDLRAFGRVALGLTRRTVGPRLAAAGLGVAGLAARFDDGAFAAYAARLGRAGRYLPSRRVMAAMLRAVAGVLTEAGRIILPPPESEPPAYADLLRPVAVMPLVAPPPVNPRRAAPRLGDAPPAATMPTPGRTPPDTAAPDEPTLQVIRALMADPAPAAPPAAPRLAAPAAPAPLAAAPRTSVLPRWRSVIGGLARRGAAFALGWAVTGVVLPYGAVLAGLEYLQGEDLRHWG